MNEFHHPDGFQPKNVTAIRSDRVIVTAKMGEVWVKAFQIFFGKDGSLFVNFPYYRDRIGLLSSTTHPANGQVENEIDLSHGGKVASHLVKYSHHPDGRAHFSQDGKILTAVKRQSIALDSQHGHMFTLQVQGLGGLDPVDPKKDVDSSKKTVVKFEVEQSESIKFVGRWYDLNRLRCAEPTDTIGPIVPLAEHGDNKLQMGIAICSPYANAHHALILTCHAIPSMGSEDVFIFIGGFDPSDAMPDTNKEAGFLAFQYPVRESEELKERIGSVDFVPTNRPTQQ